MIQARIIADSISEQGARLTTFLLTYPRFIHSEFMTHRMFSRNASSSRAIPVNKQIEMVMKNPAIPLSFNKNQKGMQAGEPVEDQQTAQKIWLEARDAAVKYAQMMAQMEVHKQYVNRILEPFAHITVVCTATDYNNFFGLRLHKDAQPEMQALAKAMYNEYIKSMPKIISYGAWHLPFITDLDREESLKWIKANSLKPSDLYSILIKRSVARCARTSYYTHEGKKTTVEEDLKLYDRLLAAQPVHASPAEHQATPLQNPNEKSGNFTGWLQYRKTIPNENIDKFLPFAISTGLEKYNLK